MKMFAVVGRNNYREYELKNLKAKNIKVYKKNIITFDLENKDSEQKTSNPHFFQCSQLIKRGKILNKSDLFLHLQKYDLIGIDQKKYGISIKKSVKSIKRFKETKILHTDLEVKNEGVEVICIDGEKDEWGIVEGYQNISLFEKIDFEKPFSGMKIGMMPSKLALFLINLGISFCKKNKEKNLTIRDPFAGFGTTCFLSNYFNFNSIASDIKITSLKGNLKRRKETHFQEKTSNPVFFTIFKHDVKDNFKQSFIKNTDVIATEGRLGPVLKNRHLPIKFLEECQNKVWEIQQSFLKNLKIFFVDKFPTVSMTIPYYFQNETSNAEKIKQRCQKNSLKIEILKDIYHRKGQLVGRQIIVIYS